MVLGVISDTHGLLRAEALAALAGCKFILHAGDIGAPEILDQLRTIAPVFAVRGNIDTAPWAMSLPETVAVTAGPASIYMLHDLHALDLDPAARFDMVVSGHSHKPSQVERGGVLYLNPGSAGPRRFLLPVSLALVDLAERPWKIEFVRLFETR